MKTLNIIGCGKAARTIAKLFVQKDDFEIGDILNRTERSSTLGASFSGSRPAVREIRGMRPAEVFLIGVPEGDLRGCGDALRGAGILRNGDIVFHLSGALPAAELSGAAAAGAFIASVHPAMSFADPERSAESFG